MSNILDALENITKHGFKDVIERYYNLNRVNAMGDALERYIQDAFSGTFNFTSEVDRLIAVEKTFSYLGNSNNPPDMMVRGGDAIEVKKLKSLNSSVALNSSYPKHTLMSRDTRITKSCIDCEDWEERDIIYVIGVVNSSSIKSLFFVYGDCFAANSSIYERISSIISDGVTSIEGIEFTETNELGKIKKIDPLGITDLRVRGMWHIYNPYRIFNYLDGLEVDKSFSRMTINIIMRKSKYDSLSSKTIDGMKDIKIKDPDNPVKLVPAIHIKVEVN